MKFLLPLLILTSLLAFLGGVVAAEIYKCDHGDGKVIYNDKPCPEGIDETEIQAVKDPKNPYISQRAEQLDLESADNDKSVVVGKQEFNSDELSTRKVKVSDGGASPKQRDSNSISSIPQNQNSNFRNDVSNPGKQTVKNLNLMNAPGIIE